MSILTLPTATVLHVIEAPRGLGTSLTDGDKTFEHLHVVSTSKSGWALIRVSAPQVLEG